MDTAIKSILLRAFDSAKESNVYANAIEADIATLKEALSTGKIQKAQEITNSIYRAIGHIIKNTQVDINNIAEYTGWDKNTKFTQADL